jgi:hypothetical protein
VHDPADRRGDGRGSLVVIGTFHSGYCSTLNIDGSGLFSAQLIDPPAQNLSATGGTVLPLSRGRKVIRWKMPTQSLAGRN